MAFESANNLSISPTENIEYDRYVFAKPQSAYQVFVSFL